MVKTYINIKGIGLVLLLLLLTACSSKKEVKNASKPCLTTHGIHSAKLMGLAESDWEVPKENICGPSEMKR